MSFIDSSHDLNLLFGFGSHLLRGLLHLAGLLHNGFPLPLHLDHVLPGSLQLALQLGGLSLAGLSGLRQGLALALEVLGLALSFFPVE